MVLLIGRAETGKVEKCWRDQEDSGYWYYSMRLGIRKITDQEDSGDWYYSVRLGIRKSRNRRDRDTETEKCRGTERETITILLY
ncbi:MAG: hypothetical protein AVO38_15660 [delta proteobacterium ML8_D]|jgi:glucan-binding YG repeat protein|nr:MAG: hypothetical protein AVO38_15660 [delta proteobacterium ML8_D]